MSSADVAPYPSAREHLNDCFERVRLLLARHIVRYWSRITDTNGKLSDLFVSLREARHQMRGLHSLANEPPADRQLPSLAELEIALQTHQEKMLARLEASAATSVSFPIENLRALLNLSSAEIDVLALLAALQLDLGLHRLATFAWADFTTKHPTVGFVAEVVADDRDTVEALQAVGSPDHIFQRLRLVGALFPDRGGVSLRVPGLLRLLYIPTRVLDYLTGGSSADEPLSACDDLDLFCRLHIDPCELSSLGQPKIRARSFRKALRLAHRAMGDRDDDALAARVPLLLLTGAQDKDHAPFARACLGANTPLIEVALWQRLKTIPSQVRLRRSAIEEDIALGLREAVLREGTPLFSLRDALDDRDRAPIVLDAMRRVLPSARGPVLLSVSKPDAPLREMLGPCAELRVAMPDADARLELWRDELRRIEAAAHHEVALIEAAQRYTLPATAVRAAAQRAAFEARLRAATTNQRDAQIQGTDIHRAIRRQIDHSLGSLAEPFSTSLTWDDIVLPDDLLTRLLEMTDYARDQQKVHGEWGFGRLNAYGRGLTALFSGPPGTGKTIAAAIIARDLGAELFRVDLSRVVDKYIGETEKNIGRVFDEAERSQAVLLFDEADSLFSRRTGVRSSNDRYSNMEVNYLLQRMEHFDGTSILTTNLATEMDDALQRRLKFRLTFRMPEAEDRLLIWRRMIPPQAPVAKDIVWEELADEFELAPGHIKNAVMRAAFRAARERRPIDHELLCDAAMVEARELGFLVIDPTFDTPQMQELQAR